MSSLHTWQDSTRSLSSTIGGGGGGSAASDSGTGSIPPPPKPPRHTPVANGRSPPARNGPKSPAHEEKQDTEAEQGEALRYMHDDDSDDSAWSRKDVLRAIIDHLAWEGMTLARTEVQDAFLSRYGERHRPARDKGKPSSHHPHPLQNTQGNANLTVVDSRCFR